MKVVLPEIINVAPGNTYVITGFKLEADGAYILAEEFKQPFPNSDRIFTHEMDTKGLLFLMAEILDAAARSTAVIVNFFDKNDVLYFRAI